MSFFQSIFINNKIEKEDPIGVFDICLKNLINQKEHLRLILSTESDIDIRKFSYVKNSKTIELTFFNDYEKLHYRVKVIYLSGKINLFELNISNICDFSNDDRVLIKKHGVITEGQQRIIEKLLKIVKNSKLFTSC